MKWMIDPERWMIDPEISSNPLFGQRFPHGHRLFSSPCPDMNSCTWSDDACLPPRGVQRLLCRRGVLQTAIINNTNPQSIYPVSPFTNIMSCRYPQLYAILFCVSSCHAFMSFIRFTLWWLAAKRIAGNIDQNKSSLLYWTYLQPNNDTQKTVLARTIESCVCQFHAAGSIEGSLALAWSGSKRQCKYESKLRGVACMHICISGCLRPLWFVFLNHQPCNIWIDFFHVSSARI